MRFKSAMVLSSLHDINLIASCTYVTYEHIAITDSCNRLIEVDRDPQEILRDSIRINLSVFSAVFFNCC